MLAMAPVKQEESDASMRQRLVDSLSHSFPGSALSKALHAMDPFDEDKDPLSSSCFAELRLEKEPIEDLMEDEDDEEDDFEEDEELTSLSWLQDSNLLKNIGPNEDSLCPSPLDDDIKENGDIKIENAHISHQHPSHVPYNPQKHINSKPPYSFSCLIFMAIEDSPMKKLPVKDIYNWILTHFPYFQNAPTGWKNSVRHNLSLNKCFKKVEKEKGQGIGKGSLWCIDPDYRPNLLQALRKTPYHPYHQLQILANSQPTTNYTILPGIPKPIPLTTRFNVNTPSPHLFPFLSRRLAQSTTLGLTQPKYEIASDIDVANSLLSLKSLSRGRGRQNGYSDHSRSPSPPEFGSKREKELLKRKHRSSNSPKHRPRSPIVITENPSEDHTYSATSVSDVPGSPGTSVDEGYDFEDCASDIERETFSDASVETDYGSDEEDQENNKRKRKRVSTGIKPPPAKKRATPTADHEDEELKIVEGADALLNLAGIKTANIIPLRSISPVTNNNNNNNNNNNDKSVTKKVTRASEG